MSTLATIREHGLIAVVDTVMSECVLDWGVAVAKGGIELIGIPAGLENVTELVSDLDDHNLTVGITNVTDAAQVSIAVAAGGEFLISPITDREIIETAKSRGLTVVAGATTPTEVHLALSTGADLVAVHPVGCFGDGEKYFRAIQRTFPDANLLVSGGIDVENAPAFLELGAAGALVDRGLFPESNDSSATDVITMRAVALVEVCAEVMGTPKRASFSEIRQSTAPPSGRVTMDLIEDDLEVFETP